MGDRLVRKIALITTESRDIAKGILAHVSFKFRVVNAEPSGYSQLCQTWRQIIPSKNDLQSIPRHVRS